MRSDSLLIVITAFATLGILCTIFVIPLNSDSDLYQAMAVDLVRYGKQPYVGSWDQNFPGIVYLHALSILLFGNSDLGFRSVDLIAGIATAYLLYRIARRFIDSELALFAPVLYALYYVSQGWWGVGQRDVFATCFLLIAALFLSERRYHYVTGILVGCAVLIRPTYGLLMIFGSLLQDGWRPRAELLAGFLAALTLFLLAYLPFGGKLSEFVLATIIYNRESYAGLAEPWSSLTERTTFQWMILISSLIGCFAGLRSSDTRHSTLVMLAGSLTGLVSLILMRKFFVYHFHAFFVFLLPLAVAGIDLLTKQLASKARPIVVGSLALLAIVAFYPRHLLGIAIRNRGSVIERVNAVQAAYSMDSSFGRATDLKIADLLGGEKNVELVSVTPAVHWMNELDRPSRFTMIHPLAITAKVGQYTDFQLCWRQEYLAALETRRPKFIVLADGPAFLMKYIRRSPRDLALEIQGENGRRGFAQLLEEEYVLDTLIGGYYIYTRNVP